MSVRLSVPYISQLVGGNGGSNCGPACLSMTLAYRGVIPATQEAMLECADVVRDGALDGAGRTGGYTTLNQLQTAAGWYGQTCWWPVSWGQVDESVRRGEPVIILLDNRVLTPRQYPNDPSWAANHFILLTATEEVNRYSSDPLSYYVGGPYFYTEASTEQGVANVGGVQALALVPLALPPEPEAIVLLEDWQIKGWVLADLYNWAGIPYDPDSGTAQAWVTALRDGTYLGRPRTEERPYGAGEDAGVWVEYDHGCLFYRLRDGASSWKG